MADIASSVKTDLLTCTCTFSFLTLMLPALFVAMHLCTVGTGPYFVFTLSWNRQTLAGGLAHPFDPLSSNSDQHQISPCNINT